MPDSQHGDHPGSSGVWQEEECHRYGFLFRRWESAQSVADNEFAAVARCVQGKGLIRVNGKPLKLFAPEILRAKLYEPVLIVGADKFAEVDIRVRVTGGGHTSQVYAVRQAVGYFQGEPSAPGFGNTEKVANACGFNRLPRPLSVPGPVASRCAARTRTEILTSGILDRLLRQVHRRALQEPPQDDPHQLRPQPAGCRPQALRAQEVWRKGCPCEVPEVLPLIGVLVMLGIGDLRGHGRRSALH